MVSIPALAAVLDTEIAHGIVSFRGALLQRHAVVCEDAGQGATERGFGVTAKGGIVADACGDDEVVGWSRFSRRQAGRIRTTRTGRFSWRASNVAVV